MKSKTKYNISISSALFLWMATINSVYAANVPQYITLADKQEIVINNGTEPTSLDPHKVDGTPEANLLYNLLEGLTITDDKGQTIGGVAESWENHDYKVWTFHLRKEAKWSNGEPLTAKDFVYSWQRAIDPNVASPYASYFSYAHIENIDDIINGKKSPADLGVKALDDYTLQVKLTESVPYFPKMLSHASTKPVHQKTIEQFGDKWTQAKNWVGNGAYTLDQWIVNERIVLKRNPYYWDNSHTVINKVTLLPLTSSVTDVTRYQANEVDITYNEIPIELYSKIKKEMGDQLHINPYLCVYYYELNNSIAPVNNLQVRKALSLALDRDIIVNRILNQGQKIAYTFTPPYIDDGNLIQIPDWANQAQDKRNQEAIELLKKAGYSANNKLELQLLYNTNDVHSKIAVAASAIWKKNLAGMVEIKLINQEWKTFLDTRRLGKHQIARGGWCADYNEPSSFLNIMLSNSSNNHSFYKSAGFDAIMAKTKTAVTAQERQQIYAKAEEKLDQDTAVIPIFHYVNIRLVKPYVGGYPDKNPLNEMYVKDLYIIKH